MKQPITKIQTVYLVSPTTDITTLQAMPNWPTDSHHHPLPLERAYQYYVKWNTLVVMWRPNDEPQEYDLELPENHHDYKRPDYLYYLSADNQVVSQE